MRRPAFWLLTLALVACAGWLAIAFRQAPPPSRRLLLTGGTVVTMDAAGRVIPDGAVAIDGDRIVDVGPAADVRARVSGFERIDTTGQIVLPGLINTHTHAAMVLFRGLADDLPLMRWLNDYIFPAEKKVVSADFVRTGTELAALEMIESGTTTFVDMYYFEEVVAEVAKRAGLRGILGQTVIKFPVNDAATPEEALKRAERFIAAWKQDPLVTPAIAPHSAYTVAPETLRAARALANTHAVPLLIHLAETRDEVDIIGKERHATPAAYLDGLGLWDGRTVAAHAVWLEDADLALLVRKHVGLAHNPESNMKLASGAAAVPKWLSAGAAAGLGTDGAASNNDLDMFEAMRFAALLHKLVTGNPETMPAGQVLELATRRGAEALGMADRIGSLEAGKQADVIAVSVAGARQTPMFDPISHLVYVSRGADVRTTIVAGRVLMREGRVRTIDRDRVLRDARAIAEIVRKSVAK
jgi:5-methylthioadenosine/S-adenosylhomocysteine deaminase